jgi:hypothetical protein
MAESYVTRERERQGLYLLEVTANKDYEEEDIKRP